MAAVPSAMEIEMTTNDFNENECEVGGCLCGAWNDWYWTPIEAVQRSADAPDPASFEDEDDYMDEVCGRADPLRMAEPFKAPPCARPTCARYAPT